MNTQAWIKWIMLGALFLLPFIPLYVANGSFFPFITGKNFAFRILVEIAFAGWVLLALVDARYRPRFSWTFIFFTGFVLWMAIADTFAVNPVKAFWSNFERMDGWVTLIHAYLLFIVAGAVFPVENLWRKWWSTMLIGSALMCGYGVLQIFHVLAIHQGSTRLDASFGNSEYLAAYLLFTTAVTIWLALTHTKWQWYRYLLGAFAVLQVVILFFTGTRGAILGLIFGTVVGALLWMVGAGARGRRNAIVALIALVVVAGGFFLVRGQAWVQHIPGVDRIVSISLSDPETTARFKIWNMALQGAAARPVTGWGQEGFNYVFNKYYIPSLYSQEPWFDRAHDIYLDWLIAGGIPALLLFISLLVSVALALYRNKEMSRPERVLLLSALAAYCFQGLFVFDNLFTYIPLAIIFGMAHAASSRPFARLEGLRTLGTTSFTAIALPITAVALVAVLWFVNVPNVRASNDLIKALSPADINTNLAAFKQAYADHSFSDQEITEQLLSFAQGAIASASVSNDAKTAVATYALQQIQMVVTHIPNDARLRLEYALFLRATGNYPDALTQIKIAEQLSPNKQSILQEEGLEQWQSGNTAAAQQAFTKAYQLDTANTAAAAAAAGSDIVAGQASVGRALLQQVFGTTTVDSDYLVVAYYQTKDFTNLISVLQQRVANSNGDVNSEFQLAAAYADAGNVAQARAIVQQAVAQHPEVASQAQAFLDQIQAAANGSLKK